jgi:hypothetical protein
MSEVTSVIVAGLASALAAPLAAVATVGGAAVLAVAVWLAGAAPQALMTAPPAVAAASTSQRRLDIVKDKACALIRLTIIAPRNVQDRDPDHIANEFAGSTG